MLVDFLSSVIGTAVGGAIGAGVLCLIAYWIVRRHPQFFSTVFMQLLRRLSDFEFFLYMPDQQRAEDVARTLEGEGYGVELRSDEEGREWLVFATATFVPDHARLGEIRLRFEAICAIAGGEYDGWGAPVVES